MSGAGKEEELVSSKEQLKMELHKSKVKTGGDIISFCVPYYVEARKMMRPCSEGRSGGIVSILGIELVGARVKLRQKEIL